MHVNDNVYILIKKYFIAKKSYPLSEPLASHIFFFCNSNIKDHGSLITTNINNNEKVRNILRTPKM